MIYQVSSYSRRKATPQTKNLRRKADGSKKDSESISDAVQSGEQFCCLPPLVGTSFSLPTNAVIAR